MKTIFGSTLPEESFIHPEEYAETISMCLKHDIISLLNIYSIVKYLGIGFDYEEGYRKLLFEVEE